MQLADGDRAALRILMDELWPVILGFANRMIGEQADAEDVAQETLIKIAARIAEVVCGGDVEAGSLVSEDWLLALERKAFIDLLGNGKTQERIMGMLQTGKPVRN